MGLWKFYPPPTFLLFPCVVWTSCDPLLTPEHSISAWSSLGRRTVTLWIQGSTNRSLSCFCQVVCDSQEDYLTIDHWWGITQPKVGNMAIINRLLGGVQRFIIQRQEGSAGRESSGFLSSWKWTKSRLSILLFPNLVLLFFFFLCYS